MISLVGYVYDKCIPYQILCLKHTSTGCISLQLLCYLFLWCPFFFDAEARIDLGKSVIDKEVVEKVGYINVFIFTLILKSMTVAKLEQD